MAKAILITGASSGIGKATAIALLKAGYTVYATARRTDRLQELETLGAKTMFLDVTNEKSIQEVINTIINKEGNIYGLINNAGYGSYGAIEDVTPEEARQQFDVNIFGLARITQLTLPYMRKNKEGKIINISSIGGKISLPLGGWYHATKHALEALSDALRIEVKRFGIDVIIIQPGAIKTEWSDIALENLATNSRNSDYKHIYFTVLDQIGKVYQNRMAAKPETIADVIVKAITDKKPKARYAAPFHAKVILFLRWLFSDRIVDKFLISRDKHIAREA